MNVKMLDTVEDSHKCFKMENGEPVDMYWDVAIFAKDAVYDFSVIPGGVARAQKLIDKKLAQEVTE